MRVKPGPDDDFPGSGGWRGFPGLGAGGRGLPADGGWGALRPAPGRLRGLHAHGWNAALNHLRVSRGLHDHGWGAARNHLRSSRGLRGHGWNVARNHPRVSHGLRGHGWGAGRNRLRISRGHPRPRSDWTCHGNGPHDCLDGGGDGLRHHRRPHRWSWSGGEKDSWVELPGRHLYLGRLQRRNRCWILVWKSCECVWNGPGGVLRNCRTCPTHRRMTPGNLDQSCC